MTKDVRSNVSKTHSQVIYLPGGNKLPQRNAHSWFDRKNGPIVGSLPHPCPPDPTLPLNLFMTWTRKGGTDPQAS